MKAIITVVGKDRVGILALIANACADHNVNILDVSQTIVDGYFTMTTSVDTNACVKPFTEFVSYMEELGKEKNLVIKVMSQDIFDSMHTI